MTLFDFDKPIDRRSVPTLKTHRIVLRDGGDQFFAAGVADMDFEVAPPIREALQSRLDHGDHIRVLLNQRRRILEAGVNQNMAVFGSNQEDTEAERVLDRVVDRVWGEILPQRPACRVRR